MIVKVHPKSFQEIQKLSNIVANQNENIWLHSLDGSMMFDVKSLLSLLTLIGKDCLLVGEDTLDINTLTNIAKKAKIEVIN